MENATQAAARDLLAEAMIRVDTAGHKIVMHVHDEIAVSGHATVEEISELMCNGSNWADGLPIEAEGFTSKRFKK